MKSVKLLKAEPGKHLAGQARLEFEEPVRGRTLKMSAKVGVPRCSKTLREGAPRRPSVLLVGPKGIAA